MFYPSTIGFGPVFSIKKKRIEIDYNTSICDLRYSRGWLGRFFAWAVGFGIKLFWKLGKRTLSLTLQMGVYYIPVRALSRMSGGMLSMKQVDGLLLAFNDHFFKGIHRFLHSGRKKQKN